MEERIGRYQVLETLGKGGAGTVVRALDPTLGRQVALKLVPSARGQSSAATRFRREAQTLARVRHPAIVRIHEVGERERDQVPFLVMELIEGDSLQQRIYRQGALPGDEALRLALELARALSAAHEQNVLHRDLKPDNVLLRPDGTPCLTDFGLSGVLERDQGLTRLSQTGQVLGTPGFWPPEQAKGELEKIGPHSDVYGLGATLYAMLTGEPPHGVPSSMADAFLTLDALPPPPSEKNPAVKPAVDDLVLACLEPEAERRPQTMGEVVAELEALTGVAPRRGTTRRQRGLGPSLSYALAGGMIVTALLVAGILLGGAPARTVSDGQAEAGGPGPLASPEVPAQPELPALVRLDAATVRSRELPELLAFEPWAIEATGDLVSFAGSGRATPELRLPFLYCRGGFEAEARFRLRVLETSTRFSLLFSRRSGPQGVDVFGVELDGPGHDTRAELTARALSRRQRLPTREADGELPLGVLPWFDPAQEATLRLRLAAPPGRTLEVHLVHAGRVLLEELVELVEDPPGGEWWLRIGLNLDRHPDELDDSLAVNAYGQGLPNRHARLELTSLVLRDPTSQRLKQDDELLRFRYGRAARDYLAGRYAEAVPELMSSVGLATEANQINMFGGISFLTVLAHSRWEESEEDPLNLLGLIAAREFEAQRKNWLPRMISRSAAVLHDDELTVMQNWIEQNYELETPEQRREFVRRALAPISSPARVRSLSPGSFMSLVALATLTRDAELEPAIEARLWLSLGSGERARAAIASESEDAEVRDLRAHAAYLAGDYELAWSLMRQDPQPDPAGRQEAEKAGRWARVKGVLARRARAREQAQ